MLKRAVSDKQVIQIREEYFLKMKSLTRLEKDYGFSRSLLRKVVHGLNGYSKVHDNIPEDIKQSRKPFNQVHGLMRQKAKGRGY